GKIVDPAERGAVAIAGQVGRAVADDDVAPGEAQMREEALDIDDVLEHAEQNDDVGIARRIARELAGIEIAGQRIRLARDQVAALITATVRQVAPQRHAIAIEFEDPCAGRDELRGEGRALVMRGLAGLRRRPTREIWVSCAGEVAFDVKRHFNRAAFGKPDAARAGESTVPTESSQRVAVKLFLPSPQGKG